MLRRRKKDQRNAGRAPRGVAPVAAESGSVSRRRARPGAFVPPELLVREPQGDTVRHEPPRERPTGPAPRARKAAGVAKVALVTGFDPFGGERLNPSWEICRRLSGRTVEGLRVEAVKVPCEFRRAIEVVAAAIERHRPALVICLGQAGGRAQLSVERVAINVDDARIPDNAGGRPIDEAIAADGPAAYFATVPVKAMSAAMRAAGAPAHVSNTAGTYVCNHLMYGVLHFLACGGQAARAGFIHVPYAEEQVLDKPSMPAMALDTMVRGVEAAIAAAQRHGQDIKASEGVEA